MINNIKLKDICTVNQGLQIPIGERFLESSQNRYFYITLQFLKEGSKEKYYIENPPKSTICNKNDILVVRTGSTGQIISDVEGCFHNNFFKINYDGSKIDGRYLYHVLNTQEKQQDMKKRAGVTTIPDLNHSMFLDMEIPYPKLHIQKKIANILDMLDSNINFNLNLIKENDNILQLIFENWFVNFNGTDKELIENNILNSKIPKGWQVEKIRDKVSFSNGVSYTSEDLSNDNPKIPMINLASVDINRNYKSGGLKFLKENKSKYKKVKCGDLLIACTDLTRNADIVGSPILVPNEYKEYTYSMDLTSITINTNIILKEYLYMALRTDMYHEYIKWFASGTNVLHLDLNGICNYPLIIPPLNLQKEYANVVNRVHQVNCALLNELNELNTLKDFIVPMLMSGQIKLEK